MPPISFLSDFGHQDEFVGVVHGVIARIAPDVRVHDIGHDYPAGDIRAAALGLARAVQYMPHGVALAVVDPGVGTDRRPIAADTPWGYFVGPDNGLLAPAVAMIGGATAVRLIDNPELRLPADGATFAGRDLFAPTAAVLASGQAAFTDVGPEVDPGTVTPLMIPLVEPDGSGGVLGEVLWIDRFGNCQTNVTPEDLGGLGLTPGDEVVLGIGGTDFTVGWASTYGDVGSGQGLVHTDSYGQIAVAVRSGRADESFPLATRVAVTMRPPGSRLVVTG